MFGPVDFPMMMDEEKVRMKEESHLPLEDGGGDPSGSTPRGRCEHHEGSGEKRPAPRIRLRDIRFCPMLILHGTADPLVSLPISEKFYDELAAAGYEDQTEFYILTGAGHGSREFFQPEIKEIITNFFNKWLKK